MKILQNISIVAALLTLGCDDHSHSHHGETGGHHVHTAPHGGELYELGPHGSGFNFELFLNQNGKLDLYVLDAHAENFVRIEQSDITISMTEDNSTILSLIAVTDSATGETIGNTSRFQSEKSVKDLLPIKGRIKEILIGSSSYKDEIISFKGNPENHDHEH